MDAVQRLAIRDPGLPLRCGGNVRPMLVDERSPIPLVDRVSTAVAAGYTGFDMPSITSVGRFGFDIWADFAPSRGAA